MALPSSGLPCLPAEIRNVIYDRAFHGDISNTDTLALMRTSKQLHLEAGSHFYANNPFVVSFPGPTVPGATVLPPINDRYLPFLKDLGVEISAGCATRPRVQETATAITRLTTIGAAFDRISVLIQFPPELSFFLQDRCDDPILDKSHPITTALQHLLGSGVSKVVQIWMNGAWFAPGLAAEMKGCYGSRLTFMLINEEHKMIGLGDPVVYEKALTGCCSCTCCKIFGMAEDGSEDLSTAIGLDLDLVEHVLDLDTTAREPLLELDEDPDTKTEEDLIDEDDIDMEDLISLDPGEVDAIVENWDHTSRQLAHEDMTTKEIEFIVAMAPHMLLPSSRAAGVVASTHPASAMTGP
ncbi:hypothetical protein P171DRAFT_121942 [Karstenula rhodostoma CBS 690.94]|uniref:Uncharacterized protein n=1 Tax=Karstenula rhodostoma CBS 690.94 TaxID=1392251 RepID=A0A9P4U7Q4_9PLEO|nr:hypothetical protein P171DRAFT_121942 [Karstenula rhodostoma CBS 690.94]